MKLFYVNWNHLVLFSPWPVCVSLSVFGFLSSSVYSWHFNNFFFFSFNLVLLFIVSYLWWLDVHSEKKGGHHKTLVFSGFQGGMMLFMLSEIFFFFSFFWAYFHKIFSPGLELGSCWPPFFFEGLIMDPFSMPLLNTVILLSSGASVTWAHYSILKSCYESFILGLFFTFILGGMFMVLQLNEYSSSLFSFKSSVYGSSFYILTGFHGMHVFMGSVYLFVCYIRGKGLFYSKEFHVSFILCSWYWHFVDVIWLFLYIFLYWYGF